MSSLCAAPDTSSDVNWHTRQDSNLDQMNQNHLCCHCTTGITVFNVACKVPCLWTATTGPAGPQFLRSDRLNSPPTGRRTVAVYVFADGGADPTLPTLEVGITGTSFIRNILFGTCAVSKTINKPQCAITPKSLTSAFPSTGRCQFTGRIFPTRLFVKLCTFRLNLIFIIFESYDTL